MADIVTIKKHADKLFIELYHLKYAKNGKVSANIEDLVEVCSQAQKSYHWIQKGIKEILEHLLRREALRQKKHGGVPNCSRIERGSKEDIIELLSLARNRIPVEFGVYIVQPAIAKSKISLSQLTLLSVTEDYLKAKTLINLKVIGNKDL